MILDLVTRYARCFDCGLWKEMVFDFSKMAYSTNGTEHPCKNGVQKQINVKDIERDPLVSPRTPTL